MGSQEKAKTRKDRKDGRKDRQNPAESRTADNLADVQVFIREQGASKRFKCPKVTSFGAIRKKLRDLTGKDVTLFDGSGKEVHYGISLSRAGCYSPDATPNVKLVASPPTHVAADSSPPTLVPSAAYRPLTAARIFHRNARECLSAGESRSDALKRRQFNAPGTPVAKRPRLDTFVDETRSLSHSFRRFADLMSALADELESQPTHSPTHSENVRSLLQNTQDASRYFVPVLQSLNQLVLPTQLDAELGVKPTHPVASQPEAHKKGKVPDVNSVRSVL
jgi:hypothetical protein